MKAIVSSTSQLEIRHHEDMTATIKQGNSIIKVDAKKLNRDESLILVEAVLRILETSMLELHHIRETFIEPEMDHVPEELLPKVVCFDSKEDKFSVPHRLSGNGLTYTEKKNNKGLKAEVAIKNNKKLRGGN